MSEKAQNVQDVFLNHLRKNKTPVTIFLVNGVKLQGSLPGSTISRCCCAATAIRSLSTSTRSRPSCRSRRCSCSTATRPTQRADLIEDHELNGHQRRKRKADDTVRPATVAAVLSPYAPGAHREERDRDAKLEEAVGLARAIDLDVRLAETVPLRRVTPATLIGKGVVERAEGQLSRSRGSAWSSSTTADARAAAQPREGAGGQGHRPHRPDPGDLRRARPHA